MTPRIGNFVFVALAAGLMMPSALAMEAGTAPDNRASTAAMLRQLTTERADQLAQLAALQLQADALRRCNGKGKFYTPGKADADADGCTFIVVTTN